MSCVLIYIALSFIIYMGRNVHSSMLVCNSSSHLFFQNDCDFCHAPPLSGSAHFCAYSQHNASTNGRVLSSLGVPTVPIVPLKLVLVITTKAVPDAFLSSSTFFSATAAATTFTTVLLRLHPCLHPRLHLHLQPSPGKNSFLC
jgi:hypothetical protein